MHEQLITDTVLFVKERLSEAEAGHDWWHIERVWKAAKNIAALEQQGNLLVIELAALLHDIADAKFHEGDEEIGPATATGFLKSKNVEDEVVFHVEQIIRHMSFKSGFGDVPFSSVEMSIVQDADRLDAIGAIGIARAFTYGGYKNRELYNPGIPPNLNMSKEEYKSAKAPTINHFYEKLLLLKDKMNTPTGSRMAERRHALMTHYLDEFYREWNGE